MNDPQENNPPPDTAVEGVTPELTYEEMPVIDQNIGEVVDVSKSSSDPVSESSSDKTTKAQDVADVIPEATQIFNPSPSLPATPDSEKRKQNALRMKPYRKHVGRGIFVAVLFALGVWLSIQARSFFVPARSEIVVSPPVAPSVRVATTPEVSATSASPSASWVKYPVVSAVSGKEIPDISYWLPSRVAAPICDGAGCPSRGTNLPGGTRFTVAPRGKGQLLPDFRGAILTDAMGKEFIMRQKVIGTVYMYEYIGDFTGRTGGGYTFTKMRGALVPVSETFAVEFNHFSPAGIAADFEKDDALFDEILKTFSSSGVVSQVTPAGSSSVLSPATAPSATPSGL